MAEERADIVVEKITGLTTALMVSYRSDGSGSSTDKLVGDLRRLTYSPVRMVWERTFAQGGLTETCILVATTPNWSGYLRDDIDHLVRRHRTDAVVYWNPEDGVVTFSDSPNGRDFVAWDARTSFDLEECRAVVWGRFAPRFTSIGDSDGSLLREVRRYDPEPPHPIHPYRYLTIRRELFGTS